MPSSVKTSRAWSPQCSNSTPHTDWPWLRSRHTHGIMGQLQLLIKFSMNSSSGNPQLTKKTNRRESPRIKRRPKGWLLAALLPQEDNTERESTEAMETKVKRRASSISNPQRELLKSILNTCKRTPFFSPKNPLTLYLTKSLGILKRRDTNTLLMMINTRSRSKFSQKELRSQNSKRNS